MLKRTLMQIFIWQPACQKIIKQHAARVNISFSACLRKAELLGRGITCRSEYGRVLVLIRLNQTANAVVDDFYRAVACYHNVFGFDVAVNNAAAVQFCKTFADLAKYFPRGFNVIQIAAFHLKRKRSTVDEFAKADTNTVLKS